VWRVCREAREYITKSHKYFILQKAEHIHMNLSFTVGSKTLLFSSQCDFFIFLFKKPFFLRLNRFERWWKKNIVAKRTSTTKLRCRGGKVYHHHHRGLALYSTMVGSRWKKIYYPLNAFPNNITKERWEKSSLKWWWKMVADESERKNEKLNNKAKFVGWKSFKPNWNKTNRSFVCEVT
jgi:hypothetical protein